MRRSICHGDSLTTQRDELARLPGHEIRGEEEERLRVVFAGGRNEFVSSISFRSQEYSQISVMASAAHDRANPRFFQIWWVVSIPLETGAEIVDKCCI